MGALAVSAAPAAACSGAGGGAAAAEAGTPTAINVLMVNNPQMVDLQKLTADNFTKQTGIKVNFTVLPENDLRDKTSQEFSSQAGQYDVATLSQLRDPDLRARTSGSPTSTTTRRRTPAFDQADILKPMTEALSARTARSTASRSTASRRSSCTARTS